MIPDVSLPIVVLVLCILLTQWRFWRANRRIFSQLSSLTLEDRERLGVTEQDPRYRASFGLPRQIADSHARKQTLRRLMFHGLPTQIASSATARADIFTMRSCCVALLVLGASLFWFLKAPAPIIIACVCVVLVLNLTFRPGPWPEVEDRP